MSKQKFYITTAIDYPNAKPHLGHAYEKTVADAIARWHRQLGEDVFFLTGTDENSQKIVEAAAKAGKTPEQLLKEMVPCFHELLKKLDIIHDRFVRTTEPAHVKVAQAIFKKLHDKGDIYKGSYEGLYCIGCEAYYTEKDAVEGSCPLHKRKLETFSEEAYFFRLSKYENDVRNLIQKNPGFIQPESRRNEILQRLNEGLRDLCVSRSTIKWGIPVPFDKKHVIYVWIDALTNYLTGIDYPKASFKKYWPADLHVIGKDINWFHTVIWPAILISAGIQPPKKVHVHGFVLVGGEKLSKSVNPFFNALGLLDEYGGDRLRFFFLREIPAGGDGEFSIQALIEKTNAELADNLGNLLQRTVVMVNKYFNGSIPKPGKLEAVDKELSAAAEKAFSEANECMQKLHWHKAVEAVWEFVRRANKYVNENKPWELKGKERLATVIYCLVESLRIISGLAFPFIPSAAVEISRHIQQPLPSFAKVKFTTKTKGRVVQQPRILFKKLEAKAATATSDASNFGMLNLKVAVVKTAEPVEGTEKLVKLAIDCDRPRTLVAGLRQHYKPEQLVGKHLVVVSNLKPVKLRGITSEGMLLAAEKDGVVRVLEATKSRAGEQVFIEGIKPASSEISIEQFAAVKITTAGGKAVSNGKQLRTKTEVVVCEIGDGARVR